jgi:hypothetical protein
MLKTIPLILAGWFFGLGVFLLQSNVQYGNFITNDFFSVVGASLLISILILLSSFPFLWSAKRPKSVFTKFIISFIGGLFGAYLVLLFLLVIILHRPLLSSILDWRASAPLVSCGVVMGVGWFLSFCRLTSGSS